LNIGHAVVKAVPAIEDVKSTEKGTNLLQVKQLADKVGLHYQMAKRAAGAPLMVPSIVHWNLTHFGAIVGRNKDRFLIQDPTFGANETMSVSANALDAETDGYALVPTGLLPAGWHAVAEQEAQAVWGRGVVSGIGHSHGGPPPNGCTSPDGCHSCSGMAQASAFLMAAVLNIVDTPLAYSPPVGPSVSVKINNNYLEANQPSSFTFTNLGPNWTFNWLSYLTVDPGTSTATVRIRGGGSEILALTGGVYTNDLMSQALLVNMGGGTYQRQLKDGSIEVFNLSDTASPPHIFMTEVIDPQGNSAQIQYDANFRITTITDAINQVTTVSYVSNTLGNSGFYTISQITDPFTRSCSFTYDSTNTYLLSITDVVGLKSQFTYDTSSSAITSMTTPYGTTSFDQYVIYAGPYFAAEGMRVNNPDGTSAVIENWNYTTTYFWDREACMLYPNDPGNQVYTHCRTTTFLSTHPADLEEPVISTDKPALEDATTYTYANQTGPLNTGPIDKPIQVTRAVACVPIENATISGTITAGDVLTISVQTPGLPLQYLNYTVLTGDTLSSVAAALAALVNSNASLQPLSITAISSAAVVSIQSLSPSSNTIYGESTSGGATESITLASAQKQSATFTVGGTPTVGDTVKIEFYFPTYPIATYTVLTGDTLQSIAAGLAAAINADPSLAGLTATSAGAVVTTDCYTPFVMNYVTSVGGAATETLTTNFIKNGGVQTSNYSYNTFGLMTQSVDPAGRTFTYTYAANNIDLLEITETQNTDSFAIGDWTYNSYHRPTKYIDGSAQPTTYGYNSSQQLTTITDANSNVTTLTYTGTDSATVGGTKTTGNVLTITAHDAGLTGGQEAVSYTVLSTDTLTSIAAGLTTAINADVHLSAIGVSATSAATVITMKSNSVNVTTYTESVTGTETITLGTNSFGFLTKIDGPLSGSNDITTFAYDSDNRLSQTTDSEGYQLNYSYDNLNRLTQTAYPDGTTEQIIYENLDAVFHKDRIGRWTQDAFDSMDRIVYEIDPLGRKTQYSWCACGSLATLTDPAGNVTTWNHDLEGRTILKTYADQTSVAYAYDNFAGRMISKTDALKQTTNYWFAQDSTPFSISYANAVNPTSTVVYSWDGYFPRITGIRNGWGKNSYTYNAYVTNPLGAAITGGGMLASATNNVIANSNITYSYDALGRTTNRSINGASNSDTWTYDAMSRITAEANALGSFGYNYVDNVSGSSKGTLRLSSINYPNSQVTNFSWYPNIGDQRLQQISNLNPSGATLSQFNYGYDSAGEITQWQQQQNGNNLFYNLGYDLAGQLTTAQAGSGSPLPPFAQEKYYGYDQASNRTSVQSTSEQTLRIGGTKTTGNVLTVTVVDPALSGGQEAVSYTVLAADTLSSIALGVATAICNDTHLQALGVNANAHGTNTFVNIRSASNNLTTYTKSTSGGATETMTFGIFKNGVENASIGGSKTTGDVLTITVHDPALSGGQEAVSYTVLAADTLATITTGLKSAINSDAHLSTLGVTATAASTAVSISSISTNATTYTESTNTSATETIALTANVNVPETAAIAGTKTTGDVLTLTVYDAGLSGGTQAVSYTVLSTDTLTSISTGIAAAVNANSNLQNIGVAASSSGTVVTVLSNSINQTTYRESTNSGATEIVSLSIPVSGWQTAVIGGSKTTGNTLSITVFDSGLSTGQEIVTYTVLSTDTLSSIATALAAAINADTNLSAIGVTASASSTVVSIESVSPHLTTYSQSTSSGATETIALGTTTGVVQSACNNVNELISTAPGGSARFQGLTNKALKSASVSSQVVTIKPTPANPTTFATAVAGVGTETITFGPNNAGNTTATFGGTPKTGDVLSITVQDAFLLNGPATVSYTVLAGDTTTSIASAFLYYFGVDTTLTNLGISVTSSANVLTISQSNYHQVYSSVYSSSIVGAPSETLSLATDTSTGTSVTVGGTVTVGDIVTVTVENASLSGGETSISYTVASGNTLSTIASSLATAINASTALQAVNVSATSASAVLSIAVANSTYTQSTSGGATETITFGTNNAGNIVATIGGKPTTGDTLTITMVAS
jgi:YD repeat-containing protein